MKMYVCEVVCIRIPRMPIKTSLCPFQAPTVLKLSAVRIGIRLWQMRRRRAALLKTASGSHKMTDYVADFFMNSEPDLSNLGVLLTN